MEIFAQLVCNIIFLNILVVYVMIFKNWANLYVTFIRYINILKEANVFGGEHNVKVFQIKNLYCCEGFLGGGSVCMMP